MRPYCTCTFELNNAFPKIINRSLHEMIKQLYTRNASTATPDMKDKGYTLLKIFRKIMKLSEQRWFGAMEHIVQYAIKLRADIEELLTSSFPEQKVSQRLDNNAITTENLLEHKRIVKIVIGEYRAEQAKRVELEKKIKDLEAEISEWVLDWDSLRKSEKLKVFSEPLILPLTKYRNALKKSKLKCQSLLFLIQVPLRKKKFS